MCLSRKSCGRNWFIFMHVLRAGWLAGCLTTNNNNSTHMYCVIVIMSPTSVRVWHVCVCVSNTESAEWSCVAFVYVSMCNNAYVRWQQAIQLRSLQNIIFSVLSLLLFALVHKQDSIVCKSMFERLLWSAYIRRWTCVLAGLSGWLTVAHACVCVVVCPCT